MSKKKNQDDILSHLEREIGTPPPPTTMVDEPVLKRSKIERDEPIMAPTRPEIKPEEKLKWLIIDPIELPAGNYYPNGTVIRIRAPRVVDIQNYSMMDPYNYMDVVEKIDGLLDYCVRITRGPKSYDYTYLKEADRVYLLIYLRELGLPGSGSHTIKETCPHCSKINDIELSRKNIVLKKLAPELSSSYNPVHGAFFVEENGRNYVVGLPTIGMRSYMQQLWKTESGKSKPNKSFYELCPYLYPNDVKFPDDIPLYELEREWETMDPVDYMVTFDLIQEIDLGISHLEKKCTSCGEEVRTDARFPEGFRSLFSVFGRYRSIAT